MSTTKPEDATLEERLERAEADLAMAQKQVAALFEMVYSMGRGVGTALDVLGLDHRAACADLSGVTEEAEGVLRDGDAT